MITPLYLASRGTGPRLRVGVLLDGWTVPRYVATILEDIERCSFADVQLAVILQPTATSARERLSGLARELFMRADLVVGGALDPLAPVDAGVGLMGVDRLDVSRGAGSQPWLPRGAIEEIRRRDLDVLLCFCADEPRGEVLRAARYGVWSYHFGAEEEARGSGPPFFRQHAEGAPTRDVLLEVLGEEPGHRLALCRSTFGITGNVFLAPCRHAAIRETTHFVVWKLRNLHELGWERVRAQAAARLVPPRPPNHALAPTTAELVRYLAPRVGNAAMSRVRARQDAEDPWGLGLRRAASPFGDTHDATSLEGFRWLGAAGHAWADPFLIERGGATSLFFEDFDFERGYATICHAEVQPDCSLGTVTTCLDFGYHLSFPYVFEHQGDVFMIPESLADGTVTLYRAQRFPDVWVEEKVLFRGNATDTTFWHDGERFYFFTTLHDRDDRGMKGMLFAADSLTGDWRVHPASPVSSDVRAARNAGAIFRRGDRLFRPAQDCSSVYGYGLHLREIVALSEDRFEERPWCFVEPSALPFAAMGVHTYNFSGDVECIDGHVRGSAWGPTPWTPPAERRA